MENTVGIRDLKAQLSKYLRMVQAGATITITDRGKPVGRLVPPGRNHIDQVEQMIASGVAEWNGHLVAERKASVYNTSDKSASDIIIEERRY